MIQGAQDNQDSRTLDFGGEDETLPWLESDEDETQAGFDTTRLIGTVLLMVVALGVIVGAIWWATNSNVGGGPEPDGSLVEAPDEPYRSRPEDAGGKTFAGTGDTSFAVGEGQTREGRLASGPAPEADRTPVETATSAPEPADTPAPRSGALPRGTAVQVGAYSNRADAEEGWRTLQRQTDALSGVDYRIVEGRADIGTVFRLQAAGGDNAGARRLCNALQSDGLPCQVK